jgi:AcrR family transcriptional regulator
MSRGDSGPRPYLRAGERRTQLLAAAAALIGRDGLGSLTVAGVAAEAGVSRQWVYEHFSDLDDLYRALILDRFAALDATIDAARRRLTGIELATFASRQVFALVPADRRILRALVDGAGWNRPELAGIEAELRERIFGRWTGFVRNAGRDPLEARTIVWVIVNAVFGLADQIEREGLGVEQAVALLEVLVGTYVEPRSSGHRPRRRPSVADGVRPRTTGTSHAH